MLFCLMLKYFPFPAFNCALLLALENTIQALAVLALVPRFPDNCYLNNNKCIIRNRIAVVIPAFCS